MVIPDNFKKIDDSFETGFENISNKELVHRLKTLRPISETESIKAEITRRLIDEISEFNNKSSKYSKRIMWLTIALGIIAMVQLILLFK